MRRARLAEAAALLALAAAPAAASDSLERHERREAHMGVEVRIALYARDAEGAGRALDAAFARIAALEAAFSDYREDSELSRLSARAGQGPQAVSADLFGVLSEAQALADRTDGAFDVSVGPLAQLWSRARRRGERPDASRLARACHLAGPGRIRLDARTRSVTLDRAGMRLDLGGIAKGWAADAATRELRRAGVERSLVAIAGDIVAAGPPPGATGWRIAVAAPPGSDEGDALLLTDAAVSTSGDAEQFVVIDGVRYSHIVDPRTGLGLTPSRQATVVARSGAEADGLATAVCVMGPGAGMALVDATPGAAASMWLASGAGPERIVSTGWSRLPRPGERQASR